MSLALALALVPIVAADADAGFAPSGVLAAPASAAGVVQIAWTPGTETADAYRVFVLSPEGWRLLEERSASEPLTAQAPEGFSGYGVAGVLDGTQSPIVLAASFRNSEPCIWIVTSPPPAVGITCLPVRVLRPGLIGPVLP